MSNTAPKAKDQTTPILTMFQNMFQCGAMNTVFEEADENSPDEANLIVRTASSISSTMFQNTSDSFPSGETLKEMVLPLMPKRRRCGSASSLSGGSSVVSIKSLLCGSVDDVYQEEEEDEQQQGKRESPPSTPTRGISKHHRDAGKRTPKSRDSYRYVIRLSPDKSKYMQHQLSQEHPELSLRRTQSDSLSTLPSMALSSSMSSVSRE